MTSSSIFQLKTTTSVRPLLFFAKDFLIDNILGKSPKGNFFFKTSKNAGIKNIRHNTLFLARIRTATILYRYTSTYWKDSDFILHFAKMNNKKKNTIHYLSSAWPWTLTKNIRNNIAISMPPYIVLVRDWFLLYFCLGSCYMFSAATIYYSSIYILADIHYSVSEGQEKPWRRAWKSCSRPKTFKNAKIITWGVGRLGMRDIDCRTIKNREKSCNITESNFQHLMMILKTRGSKIIKVSFQFQWGLPVVKSSVFH